jgi:hypothetical protein
MKPQWAQRPHRALEQPYYAVILRWPPGSHTENADVHPACRSLAKAKATFEWHREERVQRPLVAGKGSRSSGSQPSLPDPLRPFGAASSDRQLSRLNGHPIRATSSSDFSFRA